MPANSSILKLKQRLKAWNQVLESLSPQQQRLVRLLGVGLLLILVYLAVVSPLWSLEDSWGEQLGRQRQLLVKDRSLMASKDKVVQANQEMKAALARTESQFLSGANAAVAAADLLEILKNLTREHGVQLTSTKIMQPREAGTYLEVPVQVQLTVALPAATTGATTFDALEEACAQAKTPWVSQYFESASTRFEDHFEKDTPVAPVLEGEVPGEGPRRGEGARGTLRAKALRRRPAVPRGDEVGELRFVGGGDMGLGPGGAQADGLRGERLGDEAEEVLGALGDHHEVEIGRAHV
jgi:type II secretory pathway component PulM